MTTNPPDLSRGFRPAHPMHGGVDPSKLKAVSMCQMPNTQCGFPDCVGRYCYEDRPSQMMQSDAGLISEIDKARPVRIWCVDCSGGHDCGEPGCRNAKQARVWRAGDKAMVEVVEDQTEFGHVRLKSPHFGDLGIFADILHPIPAPAPYVAPGRVLVEIVDTGDYIPHMVLTRRNRDRASDTVAVLAVHRAPPVAPMHGPALSATPPTPHGENLLCIKVEFAEAWAEADAKGGDDNWRRTELAKDALRAAMAPVDPVAELREAAQALHDECLEFNRINNLGGEANHNLRRIRAAIAAMEGKS